MRIALFAAVEDEVKPIASRVHLTGIGRENATMAMIRFMEQHKDEAFTMVNVGTAGAHTLPVGSIVNIREITTGGASFLQEPMLLDQLPGAPTMPGATLFSSDCFVSPRVYSADFLLNLAQKADCFDMESSVLYTFAKQYGKPFVSYKIITDHLDVDITEWQRRVGELNKELAQFVTKLIEGMELVPLK
ncbi:MAG: hypothetical protein IKU03_00315 [Bacteroidales bacterium]|nr:hypothetical protein [Bacteroidales bacterium]